MTRISTVPKTVQECVHHHRGCWCREWQLRQLRKAMLYIRQRAKEWQKQRSDPEPLVNLITAICSDALRSHKELRSDPSTLIAPTLRKRQRRVIDELRRQFPYTWWWSFNNKCWECCEFRVYPKNPNNIDGTYDATEPTIYIRSDTGEVLRLFDVDRVPKYYGL